MKCKKRSKIVEQTIKDESMVGERLYTKWRKMILVELRILFMNKSGITEKI